MRDGHFFHRVTRATQQLPLKKWVLVYVSVALSALLLGLPLSILLLLLRWIGH